MDIRNLLQLQGAFQGYGITVSASQIDKVVCIGEYLGKFRYAVVQFQDLFHLVGNMPQLLDNCQVLPFVHRLFLFGKCQGQHGKHRYLPREGFGGCHPYFRSHVDIGTRVRGTGNAGTDGIADAVYKCPTAFGKLHGGQRIGRFSALRDGNHHIVAVNHRVAVTELTGILHLYRNTAEAFNQMLADEGGMP